MNLAESTLGGPSLCRVRCGPRPGIRGRHFLRMTRGHCVILSVGERVTVR